MTRMRTGIAVVAALVALSATDPVSAKDKPDGPGGKKGDLSIQPIDKPGKGPKAVPPGQIKRYTRGAKLPSDLDFEELRDLSKWKLDAPGNGNKYIRVDNEILEVSEDFSTVVDAVGIVDDLLN